MSDAGAGDVEVHVEWGVRGVDESWVQVFKTKAEANGEVARLHHEGYWQPLEIVQRTTTDWRLTQSARPTEDLA